MGISRAGARSKGQQGEREMCQMLHEMCVRIKRDEQRGVVELLPSVGEDLLNSLGEGISRNLSQTRFGGADITMLPRLMVEVKRQENLSVNTWWKQAVKQTRDYNYHNHKGKGNPQKRIPLLAYRVNRGKWTFCVPLEVLCGKNKLSKNWDKFISMDKECVEAFLYSIYSKPIGLKKLAGDSMGMIGEV